MASTKSLIKVQSLCALFLLLAYAASARENIVSAEDLSPNSNLFSTIAPQLDEIITPSPEPTSFFSSFKKLIKSIVPEPLGRYIKAVDENFNVKEKLEAFKQFMQSYNKSYNVTEVPRRLKLFVQRLREIEESVRNFAENRTTFVMGLNKFVDWDDSELKVLTSLKVPSEVIYDKDNDVQGKNQIVKADSYSLSLFSLFDDDYSSYQPYSQYTSPRPSSNYNSLRPSSNYNSVRPSSNYNSQQQNQVRVPASKDWRQSGCLAPIQDQNTCGACYAFATLGVIESMMCLKDGKSVQLSAQELVDCSQAFNNFGCNGGWPTRVFNYVNSRDTIARDSCYPYSQYRMTRGICRASQAVRKSGCSVESSIGGSNSIKFAEISGHNQLIKHLATTGPLVGLIESTDSFLYYKQGIFKDSGCSKRDSAVNHGIILAGYGEENGTKYWLIKNSWGTDWGEKGYGKVLRGVNECSVEGRAWVVNK